CSRPGRQVSPSSNARLSKSAFALPALSTTQSTQASPPRRRHIGLWARQAGGLRQAGPLPGVGRAREIQKFIKASSPEIWSETISGSEKVLAGEVGWPVLGYLLGKNMGGGIAIISFRLAWDGCSSLLPFGGVLSFRGEAREVLGSETPRFHHAARRGG